MISNFQKILTETMKGNNSELGAKLGDKIPDCSKSENLSPIENKIPAFVSKLTAKEINNDPELKVSQQEKIKDKSVYSDDTNESIASVNELDIYESIPLTEKEVNGEISLCRNDIDLKQTDDMGQSNLERMEKGNAPLDKSDKPIELHHIGQKSDSPLAELSSEEHRGNGHSSILHDVTQESKIDRIAFNKERSEHWKARAEELKTENA